MGDVWKSPPSCTSLILEYNWGMDMEFPHESVSEQLFAQPSAPQWTEALVIIQEPGN